MTRVCLPGADDRRGGVGRASTINYSGHVPTRKQRRRRQKTFRHEYGFVTYDEEGNEVVVFCDGAPVADLAEFIARHASA